MSAQPRIQGTGRLECYPACRHARRSACLHDERLRTLQASQQTSRARRRHSARQRGQHAAMTYDKPAGMPSRRTASQRHDLPRNKKSFLPPSHAASMSASLQASTLSRQPVSCPAARSVFVLAPGQGSVVWSSCFKWLKVGYLAIRKMRQALGRRPRFSRSRMDNQ